MSAVDRQSKGLVSRVGRGPFKLRENNSCRLEVTFELGLEGQVWISVDLCEAGGLFCGQLALAIGTSKSMELGKPRRRIGV